MELLREWKERVAAELDSVIAFWERHSHDPRHGGFFSCLTREGSVYDETKFVWLQGRQVWVYARLYRTVPRFRRPELLEAARAGGEFLLRCARLRPESPRVAFALSPEGLPAKVQRNPYSEIFCSMGLDELGRAAGEPRYRAAGRQWLLAVWGWARGSPPLELGPPPALPGAPPHQSLALPLVLLGGALQLLGGGPRGSDPQVEAVAEWGARGVLLHLQRGDKVVLENVTPEGGELPGSLGRLMNPGHALEAGWMLLELGELWGDVGLGERAVAGLVEGPLQWGWDPQHGGLFAFLDADGHCPTQLEWAHKLWWPQLEAMVALLAAFSRRPLPHLLRDFHRVGSYAFQKFRDPEHGEWFGYLTREGAVALTIKGGPYKGCFHLPRALLMCEEMLEKLLARDDIPETFPE